MYDIDLFKMFRKMRFTIFIVIISLSQSFAVNSYSQQAKLSLDMTNVRLEQVFDEIETISDFYFLYNRNMIDVDRKVDLKIEEKSISNILESIFEDTEVSFSIKERQVLLIKNDVDKKNIINQQKPVSGKVSDSTGAPLPGVTIGIKGTGKGTVTDFDGNYNITNVPGDGILVFSFVGMKTQEISVEGKVTINVVLEEDAIGVEEVVVTALGIRREKKALGYSVTEIDGSELIKAAQVNPVNALQGKTAGVQISSTSGGTFGGSRITIRGNSTFNTNTQPIFVVDGVVMDNEVSGTSGSDWGNQLKNLNSDDFESFSILKGAAATALYGSRAINGVVMITTKSGKKQSGIGVDVNQTIGMRYVYDTPDFQNEYGSGLTAGGFSGVWMSKYTNQKPDKHDTQSFFAFDKETGLPSMQFSGYEERAASWGPKFDGQEIIDFDGSRAKWVAQPDNFKDWHDTGILRNTNVAVSGGGESNSFRMSFSNSKETGVTPRNDFGKNSISIKGTQDLIKDKLSVGGIMHYTRSLSENALNPGSNSDWFHDGFPRNYDVNKFGNKESYQDVDGGVPYPADGNYTFTNYSKRWMALLENENQRTEGSLVAKANIDFAIAKGLRATIEGYVNQFTISNEVKNRANNKTRLNGTYSLSHSEKFQHSFSGKLFYDKKINEDIAFDMVLGAELWDSKTTMTSASTSGGFKVRDFYSISNSKNAASASGRVSFDKQIQSVYGYFNVAYKNDLYLNATFRRDWSSALVYPDGHGSPGFTYPSVSLSWVASETFELPELVSFFKLRASYAIVGNDTNPYRLSTGFQSDNFNANPNLTMFRFEDGTAINPNLVAEKKHSFETGVDLRILGDRIGLDAAYYRDNNYNQIISLPVPSESGISAQLINAGNLQNEGIELALNFKVIDNRDFSWDVGVNWTHNRDKIIELADGINEFKLYGNPDDSNAGTAAYAYVGGNYGDLVTRRGYKPYDGVNTENHDIPILWNRNGWAVAYMPGIANKDSLHVMGNMQADWYGGFNTSIRYKRFRVNAIFDARFGGEIYSADARYGMHQGVLEMSLPNRDASQGGITWVSEGQGQNVYGTTYVDGYIPEGVFPDGTKITMGPSDNRTQVDVGGMSYLQAYDAGLVEPTHWSGYIYRHTSASTGTPITGVFEQSWVGLRELSVSYSLPPSLLQKTFVKSANFSLTGRDLGLLYNSMPDNINPIISNNAAANPLQMRSAPYIRSITFAVNLKF